MLNLSDKHGMIQKIAEKLARDKVAPRAKEIDSTGAFPWDLVDIYKKHGFLYLMLPEKFGGLDGDRHRQVLGREERLPTARAGERGNGGLQVGHTRVLIVHRVDPVGWLWNGTPQ